MKRVSVHMIMLLSVTAILFSCKKNKDAETNLVKEWNLTLDAKNENPAPTGRSETGTVSLKAYNDNSIKYSINVNNLASGDALTAAHIHAGDAGTNGAVVLGLDPVFSNNMAAGTITGIRQSFMDSLTNGTAQLYVNVHSTQFPNGLLRAQINTDVTWAADYSLTGANQVPVVTTSASGTSRFRLAKDSTLYYYINVADLTAADGTLSSAGIYNGATGANGSVFLPLASSAADFGVAKSVKLTQAQYDAIKGTSPLYINAQTSLFPGGLVRAQIR